MIVVRIVLLASLLAVAACQTKPADNASNNLHARTIDQLPPAAQLPAYQPLYSSFLHDGGVAVQVSDWRDFQNQLQKTDFAQCLNLPWQQHLPKQLFNLTFYRYALACFDQQQQTEQAQQFRAYRDYVTQGILSSGNGLHSYSAWQINTFADAAELAALDGYEVQDFQVELAANGNALYYSLQLYDPKTQTFTERFYDNQRFLHAVEQVPFPFVGMFDGWQEQMIPQNADSSAAMSALMGYVQLQEQKPAEAEKWYLKAIAAGSLEATVLLDQLARKYAVATDKQQIQDYLDDAADRHYVPAMQWIVYQQVLASKSPDPIANLQWKIDQINQLSRAGSTEFALARWLLNGQYSKPAPELAIRLMQKAAAQGDLAAAAYTIIAKKEYGQLTKAEVAPQLQQLADAGGTEAAYLYASELMQRKDLSAAEQQQVFRYLQQAEKAFHPEAFYLLGYGYEMAWFGTSTTQRQAAALAYYQKAAERFYARAMFRLGNVYRQGDLAAKDANLASQWFLLCSRQGHTGCAFNAAVMYDDGEGVPKDQATAFRLFSYAAQQGYIPAVNRLALLYLFGLGTDVNVPKAVELLQQAASSGNVSANYYLGWLYFDGKHLPQDLVKAKGYLQNAKGHPKALQLLQQIDNTATQSTPQPQ